MSDTVFEGPTNELPWGYWKIWVAIGIGILLFIFIRFWLIPTLKLLGFGRLMEMNGESKIQIPNQGLVKALAYHIVGVAGLYVVITVWQIEFDRLFELDYSKGLYAIPLAISYWHLGTLKGVWQIITNFRLYPGDSITVAGVHGQYLRATMYLTILFCPRTNKTISVPNSEFKNEVIVYGQYGKPERVKYTIDFNTYTTEAMGSFRVEIAKLAEDLLEIDLYMSKACGQSLEIIVRTKETRSEKRDDAYSIFFSQIPGHAKECGLKLVNISDEP